MKNTLKDNTNSFNNIMLMMGLFFSQFYLWPSGLPQFSHIFIIIGFLSFFISRLNSIYIGDANILIIFIFYVISINTFWLCVNLDFEYVIATSYWIFNFILFIFITNISDNEINKIKNIVCNIIIFSFSIEILIWFLELGRYDFNPRYNGLFNDPNQMAFWNLCCISIFLLFSDKIHLKILVYILGFFIITLTMSRSATIGFLILTLGFVFHQKARLDKKIFYVFFAILIMLTMAIILYNIGAFDNIIERFNEGINQKEDQAEGRGFNVILENLELIIFGAGQGAYKLYNPIGNEIHSTWLGILFYYGIIGLIMFALFLYKIFERLSFSEKFLFLGPMVYGFTTYSARTIIFWFLISFFLLYKKAK